MEFLKNFFKDDDKVVGLCAFTKKTYVNSKEDYMPKFNATKFLYEPKIKYNFFWV